MARDLRHLIGNIRRLVTPKKVRLTKPASVSSGVAMAGTRSPEAASGTAIVREAK
jgi:hypothetical protein